MHKNKHSFRMIFVDNVEKGVCVFPYVSMCSKIIMYVFQVDVVGKVRSVGHRVELLVGIPVQVLLHLGQVVVVLQAKLDYLSYCRGD